MMIAIVGLQLIAMLIVLIVVSSQLMSLGSEMESIAERDIPMANVIAETTVNQLEQAIEFERSLRYGEEMKTDISSEPLFKINVAKFYLLDKKVKDALKRGSEITNKALLSATTEAIHAEMELVSKALIKITKEHDSYTEHITVIFTLLAQGNVHGAHELAEETEIEEEKLDHELEELLLEVERFTAESTRNAADHEKSALASMITITLIAIVINSLVAFFIVRSLLQLLGG